MVRPVRNRLLATLRLLLLALFVLGGMAQQTLGTIGELHEFTVHAESSARHSDHGAPHAHDAPADEAHEQDPAHLLLHYAHCCGHSVGMQGGEPPQLASQPAAMVLPSTMAHSILPSPAATPFRPPILV